MTAGFLRVLRFSRGLWMLWLMRLVRLASFAVLFGLAPAALAPVFADAAPQLLVRAHLEPAGPVVAGSEVKLVVDLLTTTWFTEAPNWPLFTVPDAIVSLPDEQADNLSEEIDGVHWFGVSRAYRIAPQAGKTYRIAPFAITVYPGGANAPAQVMTPALTLVTTLPPGAEGMATFFATSALTVTQNIEPSSAHLKVGESITRTIVQRAAGTEAMLIPPASLGDVEGLKRYAKPPTTRNIVQDRVGLVAGERTDSVTYSADRDGRFKLPPVSVEWWNTKTQKKETVVLPGVTFSASKAREKPLFEIPADAMSQGFPHRIVVIHSREVLLGCALVLAVGVLLWARSRITTFVRGTRARAREARRRYRESAAMAWRKLRAVARNGELRGMVPALYRWMDRTGDFGRPARLENLTQSDDAAAAQLALAVNAHYAGGAALPLNWAATARALRRMQRKAKSRRRATRPLPPLNDY